MATFKLTDGQVEAIEPADRDTYAWDTALPRFGVRVTPAGSRIYLIQYRAKGAPGERSKTRRITIGEHDGDLWNCTKARAAARKLLAPIDLGRDPFAEREADREATRQAAVAAQAARDAEARDAERKEKESLEVLAEAYIERRLAKRRSALEAARLLRHGPVAAWGSRHISEIKRSDVAELLEATALRSKAVARATYAELRPFFDWCVERDLIAFSPCAALTAPPRPKSRDRVLSDSELQLIWRAADALGFPFGPVFKLLMLTGQRRGEVAGMKWEELDLEAKLWRIPAERSKNGQAHELDLSDDAHRILRAAADLRHNSPFVFPARGEGSGLRGFSATKRRLDAIVEDLRHKDATEAGETPPTDTLPPWRIHDLRRTAATGMAAMNFPPHIVERVLNHVSNTQAGLVGVYQRHEYRAERKAAATAWGSRVAAIVAGRELPSNVTPLRA
jgi:integrase